MNMPERPDPRLASSWCREGVAHDHRACGWLWNNTDQRDVAEAARYADELGKRRRQAEADTVPQAWLDEIVDLVEGSSATTSVAAATATAGTRAPTPSEAACSRSAGARSPIGCRNGFGDCAPVPTGPRTGRTEADMFRTFDEAKQESAYNLARQWLDLTFRFEDLSAASELDEVAVMAALASWLTRWLPIHIHRSLIAGASIEEVAAAAGIEFSEVTRRWREWSDGQRQLQLTNRGTVDLSDEYDRVSELIRRAAYDRNLPRPKGNLRIQTSSDPSTT